MEVWVLYTRWTDRPDGDAGMLLAALPPERLARLKGASLEKKRQAAAAYALLRYGLRKHFDMENLPAITAGEHGKPRFSAPGQPCFSLSHTAGIALCALCTAPVGVDVEKLRAVEAARARRLMLPPETDAFYAAWVERESRIKYRGGGALQCRRPVAEAAGEHYQPLDVGPDCCAGLCTRGGGAVQLEQVPFSCLF